MASGCLAKVVSSDVKNNFLLHYAAALGVVLLSPVMFGLSELDARTAAQPLEYLLPIMGIILMTPVFMPEQNESIRDVVRSKKTSYLLICFLRLLCSAALILLLSGGMILYMKHCRSQVTVRHFACAVSGALALGSVGFLAAAVRDNVIAGYMAAVIYYISSLFMKEKMGRFYLFSMTGGSFREKKTLFVMAAVLVASGFIYKHLRDMRR